MNEIYRALAKCLVFSRMGRKHEAQRWAGYLIQLLREQGIRI